MIIRVGRQVIAAYRARTFSSLARKTWKSAHLDGATAEGIIISFESGDEEDAQEWRAPEKA